VIPLVILGAGIAAAALAWLRRRWIVVRVAGASMWPALEPGDVVLARRCRPGSLRVGDVVVFRWPQQDPVPGHRAVDGDEWLVKRVAGVPGDALPDGIADAGGVIPAGSVVVLGDNGGHDSRVFGLLPAARVRAVVVRRMGPRRPAGTAAP
jgi:signal peptidase I